MIPVVPFACLTAVRGLQLISCDVTTGSAGARPRWAPAALLALLAIGVAHDAGHWRLPRTNADVGFVTELRNTLPAGAAVAVEQAWRLGGRVYLHPHALVDLDPDRLNDAAYLWQTVPSGAAVVLDRRTVDRHALAQTLQSRGYERAALTVNGSRYELWTLRPAATPNQNEKRAAS
jgi:hypothetical protein